MFKDCQLDGIDHIVNYRSTGLLYAPGRGKTATVLFAFKQLKERGVVDTMLIFSKLRIVYDTWPRELAKWDGLETLTHTIIHGPKKEQRLQKAADICLINNEGAAWLAPRVDRWMRGKKVMLVIDESSKWKNPSALRFKKMRGRFGSFKKLVIMTGSFTPRSLLDTWAQVFILDQGFSLGRYYSHFRNTYFLPTGYMGYEWVPAQGAEAKIYKAIDHLMVRYGLNKEDLPPISYVNRSVALSAKARRTYAQMEKEFVTLVESGVVIAANAGVKSMKLRQIANGTLITGTTNAEYDCIHTEKIANLIDLVEELQGEPCLVAYEFVPELRELQKAFPDAPYIGGGVKHKDADRIIAN